MKSRNIYIIFHTLKLIYVLHFLRTENLIWLCNSIVDTKQNANYFQKDTLGLHYCCSLLIIILAVRIFLALGSDTAPIFEYLQHITKSLQNSSQKLKNNAINKFIAKLFQTLWRENKGKSDQLYLQWIANYLMIACMCVAM